MTSSALLNTEEIRKDFPVLERIVRNDRPLVYLDSANTSQKPRQVLDTLANYYERHNANIHRATHLLGEEATARYESARDKVARIRVATDTVAGLTQRIAALRDIVTVDYPAGNKSTVPMVNFEASASAAAGKNPDIP